MENDLISRKVAKGLFDDIPPFIGMTGKCVQEMLDGTPAVDAVEVIRCHECQSHTEDPETGKLYCRNPLGCMGCIEVKPDDFCSRGKKKSGET